MPTSGQSDRREAFKRGAAEVWIWKVDGKVCASYFSPFSFLKILYFVVFLCYLKLLYMKRAGVAAYKYLEPVADRRLRSLHLALESFFLLFPSFISTLLYYILMSFLCYFNIIFMLF